MIYALKSVTISEEQAVQLYKQTMEMVKMLMLGQPVKPFLHDDSNGDRRAVDRRDSIWSEQYEEQLLNFYQLNQNFNKIHKCFQAVHPQTKHAFTPEILKKKIHTILRHIIKRIRQFCEQNEDILDPLGELTESKISYLINAEHCNAIRLKILEFRHQQSIEDIPQLVDLIKLINAKIGLKTQQDKGKEQDFDAFASKPVIRRPNNETLSVSSVCKQEQTFKVNRVSLNDKPAFQSQIQYQYSTLSTLSFPNWAAQKLKRAQSFTLLKHKFVKEGVEMVIPKIGYF